MMTRLRSRLADAWTSIWFQPDTAFNLAAMRVIVATHALWIVLSRDFASISGLTDFWMTVPPSRMWRYLLFPGHPDLERVLQWLCVIALAAAVLGIWPRVACFLAGLLLYHLAPLETIIQTGSPLARGLTFGPPFLLILAFSRSADSLVLWPRKRTPATGAAARYGWPRRLIWLLICQMYFFSAYAKLVRTGLDWASVENMRAWFLVFGLGLTSENVTVQPLVRWIADRPAILAAIGAGTLVFEFTFIVALISRIARRILVPVAVLFHVAIALTSAVHIGETWMLLLFVNFEWLRGRLGPLSVRRRAAGTQPA